jgi:nucleoside 2-deoxyribosyltransferase
MTAYISISFSKRKLANKELAAIITTLNEHKIQPFIFVDNYKFDSTQEREMMQQAMTDIDHCDLLIAEVSDKAIGIGIEVGYAKAKNKPIIYIRKKDAEHSTTVSGISDLQIIYSDTNDLQKQLAQALKEISKTQK